MILYSFAVQLHIESTDLRLARATQGLHRPLHVRDGANGGLKVPLLVLSAQGPSSETPAPAHRPARGRPGSTPFRPISTQ